MKRKRKLLKGAYDKDWQQQFISSMPLHLTPKEKAIWEKEIEWDRQERERRIREGFYKYD